MNLPLLVYRRAWSVMREFFKRFHSDDNCTIQENFALRKSARRKHVYQLVQKAHKDDVREFQENFFCFWTMKSWNVHPKEIMHSVSIDLLKNKWHEDLSNYAKRILRKSTSTSKLSVFYFGFLISEQICFSLSNWAHRCI